MSEYLYSWLKTPNVSPKIILYIFGSNSLVHFIFTFPLQNIYTYGNTLSGCLQQSLTDFTRDVGDTLTK
jgi:hypothetical protein